MTDIEKVLALLEEIRDQNTEILSVLRGTRPAEREEPVLIPTSFQARVKEAEARFAASQARRERREKEKAEKNKC